MTQPMKTVSRPLSGLIMLVFLLPFAGCDSFEPPMFPVGDTVVLHSLARAEFIGEWSAFDFIAPRPVVVERPKGPGEEQSNFDVAFSEVDGAFVLIPAGLFESYSVTPGIARAEGGRSFEAVDQAPREGFVTDAPVPIEEGPIYIVRTREQGACVRYAKLEVLDLDAAGILEFRFLRNNLCNDRTLTEPDPG